MNREILPMMKQMVLLGCMCASFVLSAADGGKEAENLNRLPGTKLSADSVFYKYTADKAADGDRADKLSRWVSSAESGEHWIMAEYDAPRKVNAVTLVFWTDTHVSLDFDIEGRVDGKWVTLREVRGNRAVAPRLVFPEREVSALRVVFRKQIPDSMVRLYEFSAECAPHALELSMSPTRGNGFLEEGEARSVTLYCHEKSPVRLNLRLGLKAEAGRPAAESVQENRTVELKGAQTFRLPVPKTFGAYEYEIVLTDEDGTTVLSQTEPFFYFPPSNPAYKTASPFAAHYYHMHPALIDYVGLYWWRNHDVYGRWNNNMDEQGNADWSELDERLAEVWACRCCRWWWPCCPANRSVRGVTASIRIIRRRTSAPGAGSIWSRSPERLRRLLRSGFTKSGTRRGATTVCAGCTARRARRCSFSASHTRR